MKISDGAKEIALNVYPEDFVEIGSIKGFKVDNNAGRRACAETVAERFLDVLRDDKTIEYIMLAFYRREHGHGANIKDLVKLKAMMGTALLAYEQQLKNIKY